MSELVPHEPWQRRSDESAAEYAWFQRYIELVPSDRSEQKAARRCGVPVKLVRAAATKHDWKQRAAEYDEFVAQARSVLIADESEALEAQFRVGLLMLDIGMRAIAEKNPSLIKMTQAQQLIERGAENVRRGAGVADLKVDHQTTARVEGMLKDLLGE